MWTCRLDRVVLAKLDWGAVLDYEALSYECLNLYHTAVDLRGWLPGWLPALSF